MIQLVKFLILGLSTLALLALVMFIGWATKSVLITLVASLSAAYLDYIVAYWTLLYKNKPPVGGGL